MKKLVYLAIFSCIGFLLGCESPKTTGTEAGHAQMIDILKTKAQAFKNPDNLFANRTRAAYFDSLRRTSSRFPYRHVYDYGVELLRSGRPLEAAHVFDSLNQLAPALLTAGGLRDYEAAGLLPYVALSYLRHGELENCIQNHTSASCIVPIRQAGFHALPEGSAKAIDHYLQLLEEDPENLSARWLLNLGYMTLGQYPEGVPEKWRIPEEKFASEYPLLPFEDRAADIGFDIRGLSGGLVVDDFTNDGYLDILVSEWGPEDPLRFFVNKADGTFEEMTGQANLTGITGGLNMVQADYDNDGWLDVLVLRGGWLQQFGEQPNSLLRNNGDGTFTDATIDAKLFSLHPTQTATWADFNNDGWLDLFIGNESSGVQAFHYSELYLNQRDGTFREVAEIAGVRVNEVGFRPTKHYIKGVTSDDYDNDGWMDIYVSTGGLNQSRNFLYRNTGVNEEGIPVFKDVTEEAGLMGDISTFTTWFWDYNNDGLPDIFASSYRRSNGKGTITTDICAEYLGLPHEAETGYLYRNNGDGTFTNISKAANLDKILYAMGANFGDYDNDGWLDMYLGTGNIGMNSIMPSRAFRNNAGEHFQDVTTAGGFGHIQKGHGVSFADLDHDGDQDVLMSLGGAFQGDVFQNAFFENPYAGSPKANNWAAIQLKGTEANRWAVGARLKLVIDDRGKEREIYRTVNSGGSFSGSPLRQQIGLGKAEKIKLLEVRWPGPGKVQQWENLPINSFLEVEEGEAEAKTLALPKLTFPEKGGMQRHIHH